MEPPNNKMLGTISSIKYLLTGKYSLPLCQRILDNHQPIFATHMFIDTIHFQINCGLNHPTFSHFTKAYQALFLKEIQRRQVDALLVFIYVEQDKKPDIHCLFLNCLLCPIIFSLLAVHLSSLEDCSNNSDLSYLYILRTKVKFINF